MKVISYLTFHWHPTWEFRLQSRARICAVTNKPQTTVKLTNNLMPLRCAVPRVQQDLTVQSLEMCCTSCIARLDDAEIWNVLYLVHSKTLMCRALRCAVPCAQQDLTVQSFEMCCTSCTARLDGAELRDVLYLVHSKTCAEEFAIFS